MWMNEAFFVAETESFIHCLDKRLQFGVTNVAG
jgi:hypothetical protein